MLCTGFFVEREDFLHEIISEANLMTSFLKAAKKVKKEEKMLGLLRLEASFSSEGLIQVDTVHEAITWLSVALVS